MHTTSCSHYLITNESGLGIKCCELPSEWSRLLVTGCLQRCRLHLLNYTHLIASCNQSAQIHVHRPKKIQDKSIKWWPRASSLPSILLSIYMTCVYIVKWNFFLNHGHKNLSQFLLHLHIYPLNTNKHNSLIYMYPSKSFCHDSQFLTWSYRMVMIPTVH